MPAHPRVRAWVANSYQKPVIDQEWLSDCSDWLSSELSLDPTRDFDKFIQHVEAQLLQSNLTDSTVHGSGIDPLLVTSNSGPAGRHPSIARRPRQQAARQKKTTGATPLLVEIRSITEIAHSAFSLLNTHQTRLDRADLGLAQEDNAEQHPDEDEGAVLRFPRGMLKFELSDGVTTFSAVEFGSLPQLELGTTPLGYKMLLKSTPIRNGIAFLEPSNVLLKGYKTEDHDINGEQVFLSLLRKRLGRPDPPSEAPVPRTRLDPLEPVPPQPAHPERPPPVAQPRCPPADIDDMYVDDDVDPEVLREMAIQMDEAIPLQHKRVSTRAPLPAISSSTSKAKQVSSSNVQESLQADTANTSCLQWSSLAKTSPYFPPLSFQSSKEVPNIGLSPRCAPQPDMEPDFDVDDPEPSNPPNQQTGSTSARHHGQPGKRPLSPDPYDDLSFDMELDDSFLDQVGMIEQGVLGTGASHKGKGKDTDMTSRLSVAQAGKTISGSGVGTNLSAHCVVSPSTAESSTRVQSSANRATSASCISRSTESPIPRSTQSSDRRPLRDPSLIIISSSEDEASGVGGATKPLHPIRRHAQKGKEMYHHGVVDSDVIDLSD